MLIGTEKEMRQQWLQISEDNAQQRKAEFHTTSLPFCSAHQHWKGGENPLHKFNEWSVNRRIESLRQMDKKLSEMEVGSRYTIWQNYGGGLKATADETHANWKRIAENDDLYINALFCYMVCTLESYTLSGFDFTE